MTMTTHYIDDRWQAGKGPELVKRNPLTQEIIWRGALATEEQVDLACQAARNAFYIWSQRSLDQRLKVIHRFVNLLTDQKEALARIISLETSKPLWETRTEVQSMIAKADISEKAWHQRTGTHQLPVAEGSAELRHKPHGVMAVFGPYNFPGHLPNGHIIPALIAGNTVVFKPSELTPLTAEFTVKLWQQAGLPAGVLNLVQGDKTTGQALLNTLQLDGVLFTGSANTGFHLHKLLAGHPEKMLALEMGGNNALIVEDVDTPNIAAAINLILQSAFLSAGQRCTCARRLLVKVGPQGDRLLRALVSATQSITVGDWQQQPEPFMGGVISLAAASQLLAAQQHLLNLGATALVPLTQPTPSASLVTPGIIDITEIDAPDEEYFGPLLSVIRYQKFDEAITLANRTRFGLAIGLISGQQAQFEQLQRFARAGIVNWNKPLTGASSAAPFGGIGASGNHRPSAFYAADYCAWPMASLISNQLTPPATTLPGLPTFND